MDGGDATVLNLSSDQWNILPVCMKIDQPGLFEGDLIADDINDVKYYTPFFVYGIRFFTAIFDGNYVQGLNGLNFVINFCYTFFWAILFWKIGNNIPIALLMTLVVRGILWLPGYELWGAGAIWTALPRTAFLALVPIPLMLYLPQNRHGYHRYVGAFICGFISNFHPISGISLCSGLFISDLFYQKYIIKSAWKPALMQSLLIACLMSIGLSPYIYIYIKEVILEQHVDQQLFNEMMLLRIGGMFRNPSVALEKFKQIKWIVFILLPVLLVLLLYKRLDQPLKRIIQFYSCFIFVITSIAIFIIPVEQLLRKIGIEINMSFQLIRGIKFVMIPIFLFVMVLLMHYISKIKKPLNLLISLTLLMTFILGLYISRIEPFTKWPIIGDDFMKATLPNSISIKPEINPIDKGLDSMLTWISENTSQGDKFVGPSQIRAACLRSVIYDVKGASMLIEGNPGKFIKWGEMTLNLKKCSSLNEQITLYRTWGANYLLKEEKADTIFLHPTVKFDNWILYRL